MTSTTTTTFTRTNARYIAGKIAADLRQIQLFYGNPSDTDIDRYIDEAVEYLVAGYLHMVEYGFRKDGGWVISLRYEVRYDGTVADTGPGRVHPNADIGGSSFYTFLRQNDAFFALPSAEQSAFKAKLPVNRSPGTEPGHINGHWEPGKSYSSGGVGATREMWRPT